MADQTSNLTAVFKAKDEASGSIKNLNKTLDETQQSVSKAGIGMGQMTNAFIAGDLIINGAKAAFGFLAGQVASFVKEANTSIQQATQLNAVIASTGGAAGLTAQEVINMATSLQQVTTYGDDTIIAGQNMLLTFTTISKDVFPQATETLLDMATAMNSGATASAEQLTSQAIQLGKALNQPLDGVNALTRVGVQFTDQQKDEIEMLVKAGKTMEAQKIILNELSTEFGGSARAAADTYQGRMEQLNNVVGDMKENIGKALLPTLSLFVDDAIQSANAAQKASVKNTGWAKGVYSLGAALKSSAHLAAALALYAIALGADIYNVTKIIYSFAKDGVANFKGLANSGMSLFSALAAAIKGDFEGAGEAIKNAIDFKPVFTASSKAISEFGNDAKIFTKLAAKEFQIAGEAIAEGIVQQGFKPAEAASTNLQKKLSDLGNSLGETGKAGSKAMESFSGTIEDTQNKLSNLVTDYTQKATDQLDAYNKKVKTIQADITKTESDFKASNLDATKSYNDEVVSLFIKQQDKIADIQKEKSDLEKKLTTESDNQTENRAALDTLNAELLKQQNILKAFYTERADIEKAADAERALTDLERLQTRFAAETLERQKEHDARMADLKLKLDEETATYTKQKEDLILDTQDKYAKLNEELQKGWDKMISDTSTKVTTMKQLEQSVLAIKASIESAKASIGIQTQAQTVPKMAEGGIVTSPTIAMIGEAGPEAVVPLKKSGSLGTSININIGNFFGGNPELAARELGDLIIKRLQMNARV